MWLVKTIFSLLRLFDFVLTKAAYSYQLNEAIWSHNIMQSFYFMNMQELCYE
jgi:hypothetical protein